MIVFIFALTSSILNNSCIGLLILIILIVYENFTQKTMLVDASINKLSF